MENVRVNISLISKVVILTTPPNSVNQIYKRESVRKKFNALDGSLDENVLMDSQRRRPHQRHWGNSWLCSVRTRPCRGGGSTGARARDESIRSHN
jgi:hypothetical protein